MPALQNPRWEKFCQALVASLSDKAQGKNTAKAAYLAAGQAPITPPKSTPLDC
jgi:hypothetical protein